MHSIPSEKVFPNVQPQPRYSVLPLVVSFASAKDLWALSPLQLPFKQLLVALAVSPLCPAPAAPSHGALAPLATLPCLTAFLAHLSWGVPK